MIAIPSRGAAPPATALPPAGPEEPAPFFAAEPPHWAARGLSYFLMLFFTTVVIASIVVRVPETVVGTFTLVPLRGTDPVRAPRRGQVTAVHAVEGDTVAQGRPLFVILSEPVSDRSADLGTLRTQLEGVDSAVRNTISQYDASRRADEDQQNILGSHLASVIRTIGLRRDRYILAKQLADRYRAAFGQSTISASEYTQLQLDATRLADELQQYEADSAQTIAAIGKLQHEMASRAAAHRETLRRLEEDRQRDSIRVAALEQDLAHSTGGQMQVPAPCTGTIVKLRVNTTGAVVQEGDVLGELACAGQRLQADLVVPQAGIARVRPGQSVKLLYDAFPYQRYGVRIGRVRWVSPSTSTRGDTSAFRALVAIDTPGLRVDGQYRPFLPGMGGQARIVVAHRSLVSYAFEPIRQLRENLADVPGR